MPIFAAPGEALAAFRKSMVQHSKQHFQPDNGAVFISLGVPMYYLTARSRAISASRTSPSDEGGVKVTFQGERGEPSWLREPGIMTDHTCQSRGLDSRRTSRSGSRPSGRKRAGNHQDLLRKEAGQARGKSGSVCFGQNSSKCPRDEYGSPSAGAFSAVLGSLSRSDPV
jgi:hypothetical protein